MDVMYTPHSRCDKALLEVGVEGNRVLLHLKVKVFTFLPRSPATTTTPEGNSILKTVNMIDQIHACPVKFAQKDARCAYECDISVSGRVWLLNGRHL